MPPGSATSHSRRDVDTIAKDIPVLHHHVTDIDADTKPHPALFADDLVCLGKIALDLYRALHCGKDARELGKNAITRCAEFGRHAAQSARRRWLDGPRVSPTWPPRRCPLGDYIPGYRQRGWQRAFSQAAVLPYQLNCPDGRTRLAEFSRRICLANLKDGLTAKGPQMPN